MIIYNPLINIKHTLYKYLDLHEQLTNILFIYLKV